MATGAEPHAGDCDAGVWDLERGRGFWGGVGGRSQRAWQALEGNGGHLTTESGITVVTASGQGAACAKVPARTE